MFKYLKPYTLTGFEPRSYCSGGVIGDHFDMPPGQGIEVLHEKLFQSFSFATSFNRVARRVCEKVAQNVAHPLFVKTNA
jgi:hypothetical protein